MELANNKQNAQYLFHWITDDIYKYYCETSNINCILVGIKIVDHSDVVGAPPVGAAPTTSSFTT